MVAVRVQALIVSDETISAEIVLDHILWRADISLFSKLNTNRHVVRKSSYRERCSNASYVLRIAWLAMHIDHILIRATEI